MYLGAFARAFVVKTHAYRKKTIASVAKIWIQEASCRRLSTGAHEARPARGCK